MKNIGVTARGMVMPIFKSGDPLEELICEQILNICEAEHIELADGDIVAVTESIVARTQGNYATCDQIAEDVRRKFPGPVLGVLYPTTSRNRFAIMLKGIARGADKVVIQLSYPADEVGNELLSWERIDEKGINPYTQSFDEKEFRALFGSTVLPFTGVDYVEYYKTLGDNIEIVFSNDPLYLLRFTDQVLCCDVHTRFRSQRRLKAAGARIAIGMDGLLNESVSGSGYNPEYGILGANKSTEERVKLFPRDCQTLVDALQQRFLKLTGKRIEVMVYGDGGLKDPRGGIWELLDPVISPAFTAGLAGLPNEIKMKYLVDSELEGLSEAEMEEALKQRIRTKESNLVGTMASVGTTPRYLTDLLGSLSDLVSGSGDRGTPVVLIQGYFTNYASE